MRAGFAGVVAVAGHCDMTALRPASGDFPSVVKGFRETRQRGAIPLWTRPERGAREGAPPGGICTTESRKTKRTLARGRGGCAVSVGGGNRMFPF